MSKKEDRTIELSLHEFHLMEYFLRHPNRVLTRNQIEQNLWEWGEQPESNALSALISRLRQRLEKIGGKNWIQTVYGKGYRIQIPD